MFMEAYCIKTIQCDTTVGNHKIKWSKLCPLFTFFIKATFMLTIGISVAVKLVCYLLSSVCIFVVLFINVSNLSKTFSDILYKIEIL